MTRLSGGQMKRFSHPPWHTRHSPSPLITGSLCTKNIPETQQSKTVTWKHEINPTLKEKPGSEQRGQADQWSRDITHATLCHKPWEYLLYVKSHLQEEKSELSQPYPRATNLLAVEVQGDLPSNKGFLEEGEGIWYKWSTAYLGEAEGIYLLQVIQQVFFCKS